MDSVKQKKEKLPSLKNAQEKILVLAKYSICREYGEDCMNFLKEFLNDVYAEMEEFLNDNQKVCHIKIWKYFLNFSTALPWKPVLKTSYYGQTF